MRRVLLACLILLAAIVLQLTLLNGLPLPGGSPPDLVLVVVAALAVTGGPLEGALAGFAGGLALDIAPPAAHLVGRDALIFCLVGYGVGLLAASLEHTAWLRLAAVALGAAVGEGLLAAVGVMFSEADISWSTARQVLPVALLYELALAPFVLEAVTRLRAWAGAEAGHRAAVGGELAAIAAAAAT
ncbi:MAG: rod shape-determining protein MreD, partial [Actinobacteria bacterium]|nr:rod shape-determining protein MreD [Actinomycetota bacterium]